MKKMIRNMLVLVLTIAMMASLAVPGFAEEVPMEEPIEEEEEEIFEEEPVDEEEPIEEPVEEPTEEPAEEPTEEPVEEPTEEPTEAPTEEPTAEPTEEPTEEPVPPVVEEEEPDSEEEEEEFNAELDVILVNEGEELFYGDTVTLQAVIAFATGSYTIRWEANANVDGVEEWFVVDESNSPFYTFELTEENAAWQYRATLVALEEEA